MTCSDDVAAGRDRRDGRGHGGGGRIIISDPARRDLRPPESGFYNDRP
jgi:hypothetical protein